MPSYSTLVPLFEHAWRALTVNGVPEAPVSLLFGRLTVEGWPAGAVHARIAELLVSYRRLRHEERLRCVEKFVGMKRRAAAHRESGMDRAGWREDSRRQRIRARTAERERRELVAAVAELAYWWDGPGSEGRCT